MRDYLLLLPLIFIFHDMEEVVGFCWFFRKNPWLYDRFPRVMKAYQGITNEGMAAGVYEEFIPFFGVSLLAYFFPNKIIYALWFGIFLSLAGHFMIHIGHTIYIRKYIPSFITSLICLPVSVIILLRCARIMTFDTVTVIVIAAGILLMMVNLKMAHAVIRYVNKKMVNRGHI
ncbi:MAG: HXXEE domain-containing protein [Eubacterium sp.]|nr:HXXEE domain-containing protein [Eubacterium sp.]